MTEIEQREIWVDNVKVVACVLVVLGHFFQSMAKSGILKENLIYLWFNQTIYYFHVPLFFICSGYLYQKFSKVDDIRSWGSNVLKKALNLGVPYFTFSFVTWLLKTMFSSYTNDGIGRLFDTLFLYPTSPYWYLYALFSIFLVTPTFRNRIMAWMGVAVAVVLKVVETRGGMEWNIIQAVSYLFANEIWFVIGMCLSMVEFNKLLQKMKMTVPIVTGLIFMGLSMMVYRWDIAFEEVHFLLGMVACFSIVVLMGMKYRKGKQNAVFGILAKFTMPIFVMHTLFAASLRTLLIKVGVKNAVVHIVLGIAVSFVGPMSAAVIMNKSKLLEFFLYPGKFVKVGEEG